MTVREFRGHLREMYGAEVSPHFDFIGDRCRHGRSQSLAIVPPGCALPHRLHGLHSRQRLGQRRGPVQALYLAIGVNPEGMKEVMGLWMVQTEGANVWL